MSFKMFNSLTSSVEEVVPSDGPLHLFMCGPTVYGSMHAGHAKTYVQMDFLVSYMRSQFPVKYLMNITDVDDKIIQKANALGVPFSEVAVEFEEEFFNDMAWLRNSHPNMVARASEFIPEIVNQIERLAAAGFAYQLDDGWYFDALKARGYHSLAANPVATAGDDARKHSSADFALWKLHKPGEPAWESSLGFGRPGWHVEDTAITESLFGSQYDMHGGAVDLVFPHHEAEIAIMETLSGKAPLAKHWTHTGLLLVNGAKMAKSADNFITVSKLREEWSAESMRFLFFSSHYRSSSELSEHSVQTAEGARSRVEAFYRNVQGEQDSVALEELTAEARIEFFKHLDDDFNTPEALQVLFTYIKTVNLSEGVPGKSAKAFLDDINDLFRLFTFDEQKNIAADIQALIDQRERARQEKDFATADSIRAILTARGVALEDTPNGPIWHHV